MALIGLLPPMAYYSWIVQLAGLLPCVLILAWVPTVLLARKVVWRAATIGLIALATSWAISAAEIPLRLEFEWVRRDGFEADLRSMVAGEKLSTKSQGEGPAVRTAEGETFWLLAIEHHSHFVPVCLTDYVGFVHAPEWQPVTTPFVDLQDGRPRFTPITEDWFYFCHHGVRQLRPLSAEIFVPGKARDQDAPLKVGAASRNAARSNEYGVSRFLPGLRRRPGRNRLTPY